MGIGGLQYRNKENINIGLSGINLLIIGLAMIEAWKIGYPFYIGIAVGLVLSVLTFLGIMPILGQVIYCYIAKTLMITIFGQVLTLTLYTGLIFTLLYSALIFVVLLAMSKY